MSRYSQPGSSGDNETINDVPKKMYCTRELLRLTECMNTSVLDCAVNFTCDKNICVYGIQVILIITKLYYLERSCIFCLVGIVCYYLIVLKKCSCIYNTIRTTCCCPKQ